MHALLRHLEAAGFAGAPRLVGSGIEADGREVLTFIEGEFTQPGPWSLDGAAATGGPAARPARGTRSFRPPPGRGVVPLARPGPGQPEPGHRALRHRAVEHRRPGRPAGRPIDWETAGPVDPLTELAQLAWLNAKLHDDIVAGARTCRPRPTGPGQLAAIADAYGLTARSGAASSTRSSSSPSSDTAWEADDAGVAPDTTSHPIALWAMAWRARSAAWMIRNRRILETALNRGAP